MGRIVSKHARFRKKTVWETSHYDSVSRGQQSGSWRAVNAMPIRRKIYGDYCEFNDSRLVWRQKLREL